MMLDGANEGGPSDTKLGVGLVEFGHTKADDWPSSEEAICPPCAQRYMVPLPGRMKRSTSQGV